MAPRTLMIHPSLSIVSIDFSLSEDLEAVLKVFYNHFSQPLHQEFFLLNILVQLERVMPVFNFFVEEVIDVIIVDFKVGAPDDVDIAFKSFLD